MKKYEKARNVSARDVRERTFSLQAQLIHVFPTKFLRES